MIDIVKFADSPAHSSPEHDNVRLQQVQGGKITRADFVSVSHATLSPESRVPMQSAPVGKVYVVANGLLSFELLDGVRHDLTQGDSVFVPATEAHAIVNNSEKLATLLVIVPAAGS